MYMYVGLRKISVNFDSICYPFQFEQKNWIYVPLGSKTNTNMQYP